MEEKEQAREKVTGEDVIKSIENSFRKSVKPTWDMYRKNQIQIRRRRFPGVIIYSKTARA